MAWVIHYKLLTCFSNLLATFPFDSLHKGFFTLKCFYSQIWLQTPPHKSCTNGGKTQIAVRMIKRIYGGKVTMYQYKSWNHILMLKPESPSLRIGHKQVTGKSPQKMILELAVFLYRNRLVGPCNCKDSQSLMQCSI